MPKEDNDRRVQREADIYNEGLQRNRYNKVLMHANMGSSRKREQADISEFMRSIKDGVALELGSSAWSDWIDFDSYAPSHLESINISEKELERGVERSAERSLDEIISFKIMDAHKLDYPDNTFDMIFGSGILHHLDYEVAIKEIQRVLKPGGQIFFKEPLRSNPIAVIVRFLTPKARTDDERPLGIKELSILDDYFKCSNKYYQLFSVPVSVVLSLFVNEPDNLVARMMDKFDSSLERLLPFLRPFYRYVLVIGANK